MKKITLSALVLLVLSLTSCGPSQKDAFKFNEQIVEIQGKFMPVYNAFYDQVDAHNIDSLKLTYASLVEGAKTALEACEKIGPFGEKRDYLDAAVAYFKAVQALVNNEGKNIVEIMSKDSTQVTEEDVNVVNECAAKFDSEYEKALSGVQKAQEAFAKEWKLELKEEAEQP